MAEKVPRSSCKMPMDSTNWDDYNTKILYEIFADQVAAGNRPTTHLSQSRFDEVVERFAERTRNRYDPRQFKNKWDELRIEYNTWKKLKAQIGLDWDEERKTVKATTERWAKLKKDLPRCGKFKKVVLQNEELLSRIFEDIRNSGVDHWSIGMDLPIPESSSKLANDVEDLEDGKDESAEEDDSPSGKKKRTGAPANDKLKKTKSTCVIIKEELKHVYDMSAKSLAFIESFTKKRDDAPGYTMKNVMELVHESGATEGSNEHFIATEIFVKKDQWEMFRTSLSTPQKRFEWLKRKYEAKYGK